MPASQDLLAFHLGGVPLSAELESIRELDLVPALSARYRDLSALRYDFPIVLVRDDAGGDVLRPLSLIVDDLLRETADGDDGRRIAADVLQLERHIRSIVAGGERGHLSSLWDRAAQSFAGRSDVREDSLRRARAVLTVDGDIADCDADLPARLLEHCWQWAQTVKRRHFRAHAGRVAMQLSEMLRAGVSHSRDGRSSAHLRRSIGAAQHELFDFEAMARVLAAPATTAALDDDRRQRLEALVATLSDEPFYPEPGQHGFPFMFRSCTAALGAFRERLPRLVDVARALGMAELETVGEYSATRHGAYFDQLAAGEIGLDARDLALFPDYFVRMRADDLDAVEHDALLEILGSRLPIKVLLETDDVLADSIGTDAGGRRSSRARHLARLAVGLVTPYVLQAPSSHLCRMRDAILRGLAHRGPALFSIFTGASPRPGVPMYLVAAAALESRAFPAFAYDPAGAAAGTPRMDLSANPQLDADWPSYELEYEGDGRHRASERVTMSVADLIACDRRHARHFARVPRPAWTDEMVPLARWLTLEGADRRGAVPFILMADGDNRLQRVIVDAAIVREIGACQERWRSLRHLRAGAPPVEAPAHEPVDAPGAPPAPPESAAEPVAPAADRTIGDPYIETPRCSTCNECIQINGRMFMYDANRQAYIADPGAGTFRELVEAAESCQVSIIHPGAPRRADESGLEDLIARAAAFQ